MQDAATALLEPTTPPAPAAHERTGLRLVPVLWFAGIHLSCLAVIWVGVSPVAVLVGVLLYYARMFGLSAGFHRLLAHRAYDATPAFRTFIATLGTAAIQKGPLWWASVHRHHHRYSDQPEDAHSPIQGGFWWSHIGWILAPRHSSTDVARIPDLIKHRDLRFLERYYLLPGIVLGALTWALGAWLGSAFPSLGTSGPQMFVWGMLVSTTVLYHGTWSVNSIVHLWGARPYHTTDYSRNNGLVALWTMGEGWHNNHHRYAASERQGFRWYQLDMSHMLLRAFSWVGLVSKLRAPTPAILAEGRRKH